MILVWDIADNKPIEIMGKEMAQYFGWKKIPWDGWVSLTEWCSKKKWNFWKVKQHVVKIKPVVGIWDGEEILCHPDALKALGGQMIESEVEMWSRLVRQQIAACEADLDELEGIDLE